MRNRFTIVLYGCLAGVLLAAAPAAAQTTAAQFTPQPMSVPSIGERYHIEGSAGWWTPSAMMNISSESLGIVGSDIDFKRDLGLQDQRFSELHVVLRPSTKQKLFFQYIPITYTQTARLTRDITFNGQLYRVGVPVNSEPQWKAYRFGYEYDAFYRSRGFVGFIIEAKYTDVTATLVTPIINEFAHAQAPIPAIGGIGRVYIVPAISITGELTGIKIPDSISEDYKAHYTDFDLYGTVNFTPNIGAKVGYRSFDVGYLVKRDSGAFTVKGMYFGIVARY
jgi:hypothetical protein